jgi:hypothetical protein
MKEEPFKDSEIQAIYAAITSRDLSERSESARLGMMKQNPFQFAIWPELLTLLPDRRKQQPDVYVFPMLKFSKAMDYPLGPANTRNTD